MTRPRDPHEIELRTRIDAARGRERLDLMCVLAWNLVRDVPGEVPELLDEIANAGSDVDDTIRTQIDIVRDGLELRRGRFPDEDALRTRGDLDGLPTGWTSWALCVRAEVARQRGRPSDAHDCFAKALELVDADSDVPGRDSMLVGLLNNVGRASVDLGDLDRALEYFERAVMATRRLDEPRILSHYLTNLGNVRSEVGQYAASLEAYREALSLPQVRDDDEQMAFILQNLSVVMFRMERYADALDAVDDSLKLSDPRSSETLAKALGVRASILHRMGDTAQAIESATRAATVGEEAGQPQTRAFALVTLGGLHVDVGDDELALECFRSAEECLQSTEKPHRSPQMLRGLARIEARRGDSDAALRMLHDAIRSSTAAGDLYVELEVQRTACELLQSLGRYSDALAHHNRVMEIQQGIFSQEALARVGYLELSNRLDRALHREDDLRDARDELQRRIAEREAELETMRDRLARESDDRAHLERERTQLEEKLRQSQKLEAVGRLAGGVAHDFNNLLTVIRGYGELLGLRSEISAHDELAEILSAAERGASLTKQLLAFCRSQPTETSVVAVNELVTGLEGMLVPLVGEAIDMTFRLDPAAGSVKADPHQVEQVLVNLVVNARDAMPEGGRLTISTRPTASKGPIGPVEYVCLSVKDTGRGIPEEDRAFLFDPFFTTKARGRGTGLGLSSVHGIVRQCGGELSFTSEVGTGSEFEVLLPRTSEVAGPAAPLAVTTDDRKNAVRVLVVEDDDSIRRLLVRRLAERGYEVEEAADGQHALEIAERDGATIDVVFSDVVLPRLGGLELRDRLKVSRPELRFVLSSGYLELSVDVESFGPKTVYLPKPFGIDELDDAIQGLVRATQR